MYAKIFVSHHLIGSLFLFLKTANADELVVLWSVMHFTLSIQRRKNATVDAENIG